MNSCLKDHAIRECKVWARICIYARALKYFFKRGLSFGYFCIKLGFILNKPINFSWLERLYSHMGDEKTLPSAAVEDIGQ